MLVRQMFFVLVTLTRQRIITELQTLPPRFIMEAPCPSPPTKAINQFLRTLFFAENS